MFAGRVAIVTGAGRGLGRAYATLLARLGCKVLVNNRTVAKAEETAAEITAAGGVAVADGHDVAKEGHRVVEAALVAFGGRVDIVVNNAGQLRDRSFKNMSWEEWEDVISTHLHGSFRVTKAAWPIMLRQRYGRVVMISSSSAVSGNVGQANYSAAKAALVALAQTLAMEGARHNIIVNAVATSGLTRMTERFGTHSGFLPHDTAFGVCALCHQDCPESGGFWRAEGRTLYKFRVQASAAHHFAAAATDSAWNTGGAGVENDTREAASRSLRCVLDGMGTLATRFGGPDAGLPQAEKHARVPGMRLLTSCM